MYSGCVRAVAAPSASLPLSSVKRAYGSEPPRSSASGTPKAAISLSSSVNSCRYDGRRQRTMIRPVMAVCTHALKVPAVWSRMLELLPAIRNGNLAPGGR